MTLESPDATDVKPWGVDSEYGELTDVLVCRPDHFRWLPTSPISQETLDSGAVFNSALAERQFDEMLACYGEAGVCTHFLAPDPALPYQVFARDSSATTPNGGVVLQPQQWWRRGEYSAVIEFYRSTGAPLAGMITAAALEGGDVMIIEPGCVLIGCCGDRTQEPAARQLASWFERDGWEARIQPFPSRYVHVDVIVASLGEKLAAVCTEVAPAGLVSWLRAKHFDLVDVPEPEAFHLGVNAMSLGHSRVLSAAGAMTLNAELRSRGVTVFDPDLSMFAAGGGGPHCLAQALRRDRFH